MKQLYKDLFDYRATKSDQDKSFETAKKYLACPGDPKDLASLNFAIGSLLRRKAADEEAVAYFIKAAGYESKFKTLPETYYFLGEVYERGPYARLSAEFKVKFSGRDDTEACLLALENIYQIADHMIGAYARAVALGADAPRGGPHSDRPQTLRDLAKESLVYWYRYRHHRSEAGMKELIANVGRPPLPPEPTPITSLPPRKKRRL